MNRSKKTNSAYRTMQDRQDSRNLTIVIGVLIGILMSVVIIAGIFSSDTPSDSMPASGLELENDLNSDRSSHPITKYAQGRSIEEMDKLIDGSANQ